MSCICAPKLSALAELVASLQVPAIEVPLPLGQLGAALSAAMQVQAAASANLGASAGISAMAMAQLSAVAQATASVQAGLGIDLLALDAQAQLDATIGAFNANLSAFLPLLAIDLAAWMALSELATLALNVKLAFGVDLLAAGAAASLSAALSAVMAGTASVGLGAAASLSASATASAAAALGVDLSAPGAGAMLALQASAVAKLAIPSLAISVGGLLSPLALLTALANIKAGLGLSLGAGFPAAVLALEASLSAFASLDVSASLAASLGAAMAASAAASAQAAASVDLSALAGFHAPNLGPLTALASFSLLCSDAGFPVLSMGACGPVCPLSLAVSI